MGSAFDACYDNGAKVHFAMEALTFTHVVTKPDGKTTCYAIEFGESKDATVDIHKDGSGKVLYTATYPGNGTKTVTCLDGSSATVGKCCPAFHAPELDTLPTDACAWGACTWTP